MAAFGTLDFSPLALPEGHPNGVRMAGYPKPYKPLKPRKPSNLPSSGSKSSQQAPYACTDVGAAQLEPRTINYGSWPIVAATRKDMNQGLRLTDAGTHPKGAVGGGGGGWRRVQPGDAGVGFKGHRVRCTWGLGFREYKRDLLRVQGLVGIA